LADLVDLRLLAISLKVDELLNSGALEDMMTTTRPLSEAQPAQEGTKRLEANICVGATTEDLYEQSAMPPHAIKDSFRQNAQPRQLGTTAGD
jgi:hypothetical protein